MFIAFFHRRQAHRQRMPTDPWREVGDGELPVKGPPTVGFHAGYAPKTELNRWASFSHFKIAELGKE